jgi:hypothetical protein
MTHVQNSSYVWSKPELASQVDVHAGAGEALCCCWWSWVASAARRRREEEEGGDAIVAGG